MIKKRLNFAKEYFSDAIELYKSQKYNSSSSRAYYSAYQAMWAALGDPQNGKRWKHGAIARHFIRGYWFKSDHPKNEQGLLEDKHLALKDLYTYRINSDYKAINIDHNELKNLLEILEEIINFIDQKINMEV